MKLKSSPPLMLLLEHPETFPHLREDERLRAAAVQAQDEADGLKQLLDAAAKLLLLHPTGGPGVQDPGLDDELKQILQRLETSV